LHSCFIYAKIPLMRLGQALNDYRLVESRTVRDVAKEVGISPATLSRIENNKPCDSDTLAAILLWLIGKPKAGSK
jgi:DNA-binding XRE family transcriptional regulator